MENKNYVIKRDEMEVVDGKVVISSEELASAIMSSDVDLSAEEELDVLVMFCKNGSCS